MRFCPSCDNIIIPKNGKLYCQACEEEFELPDNQADYKIIKKIKHDDSAESPIVIKGDSAFKSSKISNQDRKAYEEFFRGDGAANSY